MTSESRLFLSGTTDEEMKERQRHVKKTTHSVTLFYKVARFRESYSMTRGASWEKENRKGTSVLKSVVMTFCFDGCLLVSFHQ
jgi:hypothetical protein